GPRQTGRCRPPAPQEGSQPGQGPLRHQQPPLQARPRIADARALLCVPRPADAEARHAPALDHPDQRGIPPQRLALLPPHPGADSRGRCGRSEDPRRPGGSRRGRFRGGRRCRQAGAAGVGL
ncbi:MAG: LSU ribosomal protein L20p, partial [uncultured Thermomicrobiales bacterium]